MKIKIVTLCLLCSFRIGFSQKNIANVEIRKLDNTSVMSGDLVEEGRPTLIVFWATWCSHTKDALTSINDDYLEDWISDFDLNLIAISVDDSRNLAKVKPFADGQGWEFDVFTDVNSDFKRAMNVNNAPHFMLFDLDGNLVWQQNSFAPGDEYTIEKQLININN